MASSGQLSALGIYRMNGDTNMAKQSIMKSLFQHLIPNQVKNSRVKAKFITLSLIYNPSTKSHMKYPKFVRESYIFYRLTTRSGNLSESAGVTTQTIAWIVETIFKTWMNSMTSILKINRHLKIVQFEASTQSA